MWTVGDANLIAHLLTLPHADRAALLVALLRADPDAAVEAVDTCKVARAWTGRSDDRERRPIGNGGWIASGGIPHHGGGYWSLAVVDAREITPPDSRSASPEEACANADAALLSDGWVLAGVDRG